MQLSYTAPEHVCDAIAALGRTEDVKFSPNNNRFAVASFSKNEVTVFDICIDTSRGGREITLTDVAKISSSYLKEPHGIDFIDDENIIVANRQGHATIFKLPSGGGGNCYELSPLEVIRCGDVLHSPGAVAITRRGENICEALICNNFGKRVTKHLIDLGANCSVRSSEILLKKWLDLPDGVSVSEPWIAISNHNVHSVFLYENTASLSGHSDPDGILRRVHYPHGLRFTSDGQFILVADAGAPYVNIYMKDALGWRGVRSPLKSFRVLSDDDFLRGKTTAHDGGPKGIDIDHSMTILVTTCEIQPLAFFDMAETLEWTALAQRRETHCASGSEKTPDSLYENYCRDQIAFEMQYVLDKQYESNEAMARMLSSRSWRITAPLRWLSKRTFLARTG